MDFTLSVDPATATPALERQIEASSLSIAVDHVILRVGSWLTAEMAVTDIIGAVHMPDPRPTVKVPLGLSMGTRQWGRDMLCLLGSYDGLVRVDFRHPVVANPVVSIDRQSTDPSSDSGTVTFHHLLMSLADPDAFIDAIGAARHPARY